MELKSRLSSSFYAICTHSIGSQTTQGKCVHDSIDYISSSTSIPCSNFYSSGEKMFCDQRILDDQRRQIFVFKIFVKIPSASLNITNHKGSFS